MKTKTPSIPNQIRQTDRARLDLYVNKIVGDEPHLARVRDISTSGVYLYKLLEPEMNQSGGQVGLEIKLPNRDDVIWAVGEVVREDESALTDGVAIRFSRIAESDRALIGTYVQGQQSGRATQRI